MTSQIESLVDIDSGAEAVKPRGKFPCHYCPEDQFSTPIPRRNHERSLHKAEFDRDEAVRSESRKAKKGSAEEQSRGSTPAAAADLPQYRATTVAGVRMDTVSELTRKFAEALDSTAPEMSPGKKRQLILAFDEHSIGMGNNRARLEHFLNASGLLASQAEFIKLVMLGMDDGSGSAANGHWSSPNGAPQAMTYDPLSGRMVAAPIFMLGGNNAPANPASAPPFFFMPPGYGQPPPGDGLTRRDLDDAIDRLADKLTPPPPAQTPTPVNVRRYQRPIVGSDGEPMTDAGGHPLMAWVEEPMDQLSGTIQMLSNLGVIGKSEAPPLTAEVISEAVVAGVEQVIPQTRETDPEIAELRREVSDSHKVIQDYIHRTELKEAEQKAADEAVYQTMARVQPLLDELKDVRSKTGLTDRQYELSHQGGIVKDILGAFQQGISGLRADLQPFAMQGMVAQMKTLNIDDNVIGDILQRMATPAGGAGANGEDRRAETMRKWAKE